MDMTRWRRPFGLKPDNITQALTEVEGVWKKFSPHFPFDYQFLDEVFEEQDPTDQRTGAILKYFAILAVFISCLGILDLAAFTAEQRANEIDIRKVLGPSISGIVSLVSKEFI
jgi:putative ABC transport system permease protein